MGSVVLMDVISHYVNGEDNSNVCSSYIGRMSFYNH
jgi:hypothetical protein